MEIDLSKEELSALIKCVDKELDMVNYDLSMSENPTDVKAMEDKSFKLKNVVHKLIRAKEEL